MRSINEFIQYIKESSENLVIKLFTGFRWKIVDREKAPGKSYKSDAVNKELFNELWELRDDSEYFKNLGYEKLDWKYFLNTKEKSEGECYLGFVDKNGLFDKDLPNHHIDITIIGNQNYIKQRDWMFYYKLIIGEDGTFYLCNYADCQHLTNIVTGDNYKMKPEDVKIIFDKLRINPKYLKMIDKFNRLYNS